MEKWLLQVEKQMVASLKDVISRAAKAYFGADVALTKWALEWPGQAVQCARSINWTGEAVAAILDKVRDKMPRLPQSTLTLIFRRNLGLVRL